MRTRSKLFNVRAGEEVCERARDGVRDLDLPSEVCARFDTICLFSQGTRARVIDGRFLRPAGGAISVRTRNGLRAR